MTSVCGGVEAGPECHDRRTEWECRWWDALPASGPFCDTACGSADPAPNSTAPASISQMEYLIGLSGGCMLSSRP